MNGNIIENLELHRLCKKNIIRLQLARYADEKEQQLVASFYLNALLGHDFICLRILHSASLI